MRVAVASSVGYGSITPSRLLFPAVRPGSAKAVFGPLRRLRLAGARPAAPGEAFRSSVGSPGKPVEAVAESRAAPGFRILRRSFGRFEEGGTGFARNLRAEPQWHRALRGLHAPPDGARYPASGQLRFHRLRNESRGRPRGRDGDERNSGTCKP